MSKEKQMKFTEQELEELREIGRLTGRLLVDVRELRKAEAADAEANISLINELRTEFGKLSATIKENLTDAVWSKMHRVDESPPEHLRTL